MKRWLQAAILISWLSAAVAAAATAAEGGSAGVQDLFLQAAEAYKKGDYEASVRLNSQALSRGVESAALHYNLGNSYLRLRQVGRAIVSYLRAERLAPGDVDVQANLSYARGMVASPVAAPPWPFWARPFQRLSFDELRWAALFVFMFTATVVLAALYAGWKPRKIWGWALTGGLLLAYLVVGAFYRLSLDSGRGVCLDRVEVKFEPVPQATTYYKLPEGAEIRVLREKDGWFKIERPDHKTGWVPVPAVARI